MLILRRKDGQWIEVVHRSGDVMMVQVRDIRPRFPGQLDLAFDDAPRNFSIRRVDRRPAQPREDPSRP